MALEKPAEYQEVSAKQNEETVYAEDINQIISNIEKIKGGEADEAPASDIKDLDSRLKTLESGSSSAVSDAGGISFDNTNAGLDFSLGYDFPQVKNELKKSYTITLCGYDSEYIETAQKYYLTLELQENGDYVLKGSLNVPKQNGVCDFIIAELDDGENKSRDFGYILNVLLQFLPYTNTPFKDGEIQAQTDTKGLQYRLGSMFGVNMLRIQTADDNMYNAPADSFDITLNIVIAASNIKNNNEYIPVMNSGSLGIEYLKIEVQNGKAVIKGSISKYASYGFVLFSHEALEYYFDVKSTVNEAYYTNGEDGLKAENSKQVQYYIRKETIDMGDISASYIGYSASSYYLEIKYTDGSSISSGDCFVFNMTALKNADVQKKEKPHTIQNAVEILASKKTVQSTFGFNRAVKLGKFDAGGLGLPDGYTASDMFVYEVNTMLPIIADNSSNESTEQIYILAVLPKECISIFYYDLKAGLTALGGMYYTMPFTSGAENSIMISPMGDYTAIQYLRLKNTGEENAIDSIFANISNYQALCSFKFVSGKELDGFNTYNEEVKLLYETVKA